MNQIPFLTVIVAKKDIESSKYILSLLFKFMLPVAVGVLVRSCVGIKHSYIQICTFKAPTPEAITRNV